MNPSFNASRFARLMRAHWAENRRNYGWFAAVAAIVDVIVLVLFFAGASSNNRFEAFGFESQVVWFTIGLFLTAPIFAARYFDNLSTSGSALVLLMRPASIFEKWLMSLLWVGLLFPLAFVALYMLLHFPFVSLAQALYVPPDNSGSARYATDLRFYVPFFHYGKQLADVADAKQYFLFEVFIALLVSGLQMKCGYFVS